ncbi:MAG: HAMP domain-containing histidine kinase [Clostridiales bacterium]|jgi:two-component system sporulation sensor kinase A|nr:HAMP domain-containing histidine kinase [Clostridiales bacterium]
MNEKEISLDAREMLAASLAHEIKSPLSLVQANIDFIELCDTEKKHLKNYSVMRNELRKANELVGSLVELAKPDGCRGERIDLRDLALEAVSSYLITPGSEIDFVIKKGDDPLYFMGSRQIFAMLISGTVKNAIEALGGKGKIEIHMFRSGGAIIMTVRDNGCGLTQDALERIGNDEYFTTKRYGNGMGIVICKRIARDHGGTYEINNGKDGGCVVRVTLPPA